MRIAINLDNASLASPELREHIADEYMAKTSQIQRQRRGQKLAPSVRAGYRWHKIQAPEARHLAKDIFRIKAHSMPLQQRNKLLFETHFLAMSLLILDIPHNRI